MNERAEIINEYNEGEFGEERFNELMEENQSNISKYLGAANSNRQEILNIIKQQSRAELDAINKNIDAYKEMLNRKK